MQTQPHKNAVPVSVETSKTLASEILTFELKISKGKPTTSEIPPSIYLRISKNKEYPMFYRHAWGTAYVSTNQQGTDRFPVEYISLDLSMPNSAGGYEKQLQDRANAAEVSADVKYAGPTAIGDFTAHWVAKVADSRYDPNPLILTVDW